MLSVQTRYRRCRPQDGDGGEWCARTRRVAQGRGDAPIPRTNSRQSRVTVQELANTQSMLLVLRELEAGPLLGLWPPEKLSAEHRARRAQTAPTSLPGSPQGGKPRGHWHGRGSPIQARVCSEVSLLTAETEAVAGPQFPLTQEHSSHEWWEHPSPGATGHPVLGCLCV